MQRYYQQNQDPDLYDIEILAQLSIYFDSKNKTISFACDWMDSNDGLDYIAEIFNKLKSQDFIDKILDGLYQQCILNKNLDEYNLLIEKISNKSKTVNQLSEVLVKPTDITRLK